MTPRILPALLVLAVATGCAGSARHGMEGYDRPSKIIFTIGPSGRISVDDRGVGDLPVLFVHGNGCDKSQWDEQLRHVSATGRAIAIDLHGFGKSDMRVGGDYSMDAFVKDIEAVATGLYLKKFVLVGHSFGGAVINAYAGRHPEKVAGVLYVDPAGDLSRIPRQNLQGWLDKMKPETYDTYTVTWFNQILEGSAPGVREKVLASLKNTEREVFVAAIDDLVAYDPIPDLKAYHGPRLTVITESNEKPFSLQNLVPDLPFEKITGTSHWLMMDKPEEFDRILDKFLARVEAGDGA